MLKKAFWSSLNIGEEQKRHYGADAFREGLFCFLFETKYRMNNGYHGHTQNLCLWLQIL